MTNPAWRVYQLAELIEKTRSGESPYHEFLRVPSLSCGVYQLPAGATDLQGPHDEDEVYFVIEGRARLRVDGRDHEVKRGSIMYVGSTSEHSFVEIVEDMTLLVFFASGGPDL